MDQGMFSVANFLLTVFIVRTYSSVELASYGLALSIVLMLQGAQSNCYLIYNAVLIPEIVRRRASKLIGQQAIVLLSIVVTQSIVTLLIYIYSDSTYFLYISVCSIVCSLIYMQLEFERIMYLKHEKYIHSAILSFGFIMIVCSLFIWAHYFDLSFISVLGIISVYMVLKIILLYSHIAMPDFFWGWRLLKRDIKRSLGGSIASVLGYAGHNHLPLLILGWFATPFQVSIFTVTRSLTQPLQIIVRGVDIIDKNFFQERVRKAGSMMHVLRHQLMIYSGVSILMLIVSIFFGEFILSNVYGDEYAQYNHVFIIHIIMMAMLAILFPVTTVMVRHNTLNKYNYWRMSAGALGVISAWFLCAPFGATGAAMACLIGWVLSMAIAGVIVYKDLKSSK